jgi:hypothetical protein
MLYKVPQRIAQIVVYRMDAIIAQFSLYLGHALGSTPAIKPWKEEDRLAFFLRDRYRFFEAQVLSNLCLLMFDTDNGEVPAATIRKHIVQLQARWRGPVIYVRERITAYNRNDCSNSKSPSSYRETRCTCRCLASTFASTFDNRDEIRRGCAPRPRPC